MKFVVKYVRRDKTGREVSRTAIVGPFETQSADIRWINARSNAMEGLREGERVVQISEAGYQ
jgi:hypothetical protein